MLNLVKRERRLGTQLFDYYLGWLEDPSITHHFLMIPIQSALRQAAGA